MLHHGHFGSMFLALVLSLAVGATAFAAPQPVSREGASKVIMDPSLADKLEREAAPSAREAARKVAVLQEKAEVGPNAVPVPGDVRVVVRPWTSGYTYFDQERRGTASVIWSYTLTIAGFLTEGVSAVIVGVASFLGDQLSQIDQNKGATARLLHSYRYPEKQAEVYTNNRTWVTYYTAQPRQWYKHRFASYVNKSGVTRTSTVDYTADLGYSPIRTDSTTHYNNNAWLSNKALELYRQRSAPQCESFTYPCL
ncbi:MAG TPA: hypothetical protein VK464_24580 [Symbiobacteriaceae bacterium]|jgi:hypothetical protein|nr:hypothetical protein [Symbiobacteriaceae bacterium]